MIWWRRMLVYWLCKPLALEVDQAGKLDTAFAVVAGLLDSTSPEQLAAQAYHEAAVAPERMETVGEDLQAVVPLPARVAALGGN